MALIEIGGAKAPSLIDMGRSLSPDQLIVGIRKGQWTKVAIAHVNQSSGFNAIVLQSTKIAMSQSAAISWH
jgi:hypothetical protein